MRNSLTRSSALWTLTAWLIAGLVCVPILVTLFSITTAPSPIWEHLKATVLTEYVVNSIVLMGLTGDVLISPWRFNWLADRRLYF
jgi:iron(III) transport system permease protein